MLTTVLMFIAAMALSAVAGYYSVIGLTTIFSSAFIPVLIMAGTLETSKVIVASWLYNKWRKTPLHYMFCSSKTDDFLKTFLFFYHYLNFY